ncbi:coiled-coil domain-containing protein 112 [Dendroctonus ponderosae]|uniref:coiled-coil domain-containing protein 112 n=1 Tax=Dendroctonus ponderosae TaxID=77166 RepID=UPI0020351198|nr:coiled-coil domain-containing protein 112 [Dendroctonus ponderosae]KAH1012478.1 hypothetical protein HUJ05_011633 [Dendroctonus ponderosae]
MLLLNNIPELNKLQQLECTLEKSIESFISTCSKTMPEFESDLSGIYQATQDSCNQEISRVSQNIQTIAKSLKSKADLLKDKKMSEINDFEKFKAEMVLIQENIMNLKRTSKLELNRLKQLEIEMADELESYYNVKLPEWSERFHISNLDLIPARIKNKQWSGQPNKDVKEYFDFVHQSGGHENGWRKEDHLLFLKLRKKFTKLADLAANLHEILPDISLEEITQHNDWYTKYLQLQSKKKKAIHKWKLNKTSSKITENHESPTITPLMKEDASAFREKLMQWKAEKEEKMLIDQELEKLKLQEIIERERAKKHRHIEMKKLVNEWRESKMIFEQSQKQQQRILEELEKKKRGANANKLIKQFQSMDELHIMKMRQIHKKITNDPKKRVQSGPSVSRDPNRVAQPTIQWAQRVRAAKEPFKGPLPIFDMPKLAIPEWRKTIT